MVLSSHRGGVGVVGVIKTQHFLGFLNLCEADAGRNLIHFTTNTRPPTLLWSDPLFLPNVSVQVINVDDDGNELGSGVMELTDAELVLHTHRRDDVRWPYLCLRRYGYDSNLFSFESGRRCQTGQGIIGGGFLPLKRPWIQMFDVGGGCCLPD